MAESFLHLSAIDRADALEVAASLAGRPAELLEKDVWVVWTLDTLFRAPFGEALTFKGGTSLSKAYGAIDRFSEDVDLTYDIRALFPEFAGHEGDPIPPSRSKADHLSDRVRVTLPQWVGEEPVRILKKALGREGMAGVELRVEGSNLIVGYRPSVRPATDYVRTEVLVEFGARSSGEPAQIRSVTCDAAAHLEDLVFPTASPRVMAVERTFWEKATAAHVYCLQGRLRGERFARHWYDLARLEAGGFAEGALRDRELADRVAKHKGRFFRENDATGTLISYARAVRGELVLVPEGAARFKLSEDYERMLTAGLLPADAASFEDVLKVCGAIQERANG